MGRWERVRPPVMMAVVLWAITAACPHAEALSSAEAQQVDTGRRLQVADFFVPETAGYVTERHPATSPEAPVVIHIQEAHTNYEGQKSLVAILEQLIKQYGLRLILVEGGEGDASLAYLRGFGSLASRKARAEEYLKAGIFSGEEYLEITSDYPLILWGVEEQALYEQNVQGLTDHDQLKLTVQPMLATLREVVEVLKPTLLGPAITAVDQATRTFDDGTLSLTEYVDFLIETAKSHHLSDLTETYPNLAHFQMVRSLEQTLDLEQVSQEQRALVNQLSRLATEQEMQDLKALAGQLHAGTIEQEVFYAELGRLASTHEVDVERQFPGLTRYFQYLAQQAELDPLALSNELDGVVARLRTQLAVTPASQQLLTIADQLELLEKLTAIQLSPDEYAQLSQLDLTSLPTWLTFLNEQLTLQGMAVHVFPQLEELPVQIQGLLTFYQTAATRDAVIVRNALTKLHETKETLAVLITGGFHSPGITELLKAEQVGLIVVTPKVSASTNERLYRAVLNYKSGHGSFTEVMTVANASAAQTLQEETH